MTTEPATQHLIEELRQTLDHMSADLDRVEVLTAALHGFARSIPDYEPRFRHINHAEINYHEIADAE